MSTHPAERFDEVQVILQRVICRDAFAILFGPRTGEILLRAQRCLRPLLVTGALLASLFLGAR